MAFPLVPVVAGVAGVGAVALAIKAKHASDAAALANQCDDIRTQIEALAATGGDPHQLETLRVALSACARRAAAAGVTIPVETVSLLPCRATRAYMRAQWDDYKRTSYSDPVSRDNKRNAILSQGAALVACLRAALASATTAEQVRAVVEDIRGAANESRDRALCLMRGGDGCGRFGLNEEDGFTRGRKELEAVGMPLGASWHPLFLHAISGGDFDAAFRAAEGLPSRTMTTVDRGHGRTASIVANPLDESSHGGLLAEAEAKLAGLNPRLRANAALAPLRADLVQGLRLSLAG